MENAGVNCQHFTGIVISTVLFSSLFWSLEVFISLLLFCPSSSLFMFLPLFILLAVLPVSSSCRWLQQWLSSAAWAVEKQHGHHNPQLGSQRYRMDTATHVWGLRETGWTPQPTSGVLEKQDGHGSLCLGSLRACGNNQAQALVLCLGLPWTTSAGSRWTANPSSGITGHVLEKNRLWKFRWIHLTLGLFFQSLNFLSYIF